MSSAEHIKSSKRDLKWGTRANGVVGGVLDKIGLTEQQKCSLDDYRPLLHTPANTHIFTELTCLAKTLLSVRRIQHHTILQRKSDRCCYLHSNNEKTTQQTWWLCARCKGRNYGSLLNPLRSQPTPWEQVCE